MEITNSPATALTLAGLAAVVVLGIALGRYLARRKLEHWARGEGFRLLEFRGLPFWRVPNGWLRNDTQEDYRVVVIDRGGDRRVARVRFKTSWHGIGPPDIEVHWDELV